MVDGDNWPCRKLLLRLLLLRALCAARGVAARSGVRRLACTAALQERNKMSGAVERVVGVCMTEKAEVM